MGRLTTRAEMGAGAGPTSGAGDTSGAGGLDGGGNGGVSANSGGGGSDVGVLLMLFGSLPARYSARLLEPSLSGSPNASAGLAGLRPFANSQLSCIPSPS